VPYTQSAEFFSAAFAAAGEVPSKLVIFPDEGHWVIGRPVNSSQFWYKTFLGWVDKYTK